MPWQWLPVQVLETGPKLDKLRLVESRLVKFELAKMRVMAHDATLLGNEVWERDLVTAVAFSEGWLPRRYRGWKPLPQYK